MKKWGYAIFFLYLMYTALSYILFKGIVRGHFTTKYLIFFTLLGYTLKGSDNLWDDFENRFFKKFDSKLISYVGIE